MDNPKGQLVEKLKNANNILVTVSNNPSVDQLAACIGLTLLLNKLKKHATAVYSGETPSTIEFLKPEETLEKTTDSLRDFIISLDKSKADKLRYKVEDRVVKIFITPYRTALKEEDLEFSQGDFNVDAVVALGVREQADLDQAITAHGRILHDAVVASINVTSDGGLGTINWHEPAASSLSELVAELGRELGEGLVDDQVATALLTGIVAETNRFSNEKTSPVVMKISAELLAAGANQQLVATQLQQPGSSPAEVPKKSANQSSSSDAQPVGTDEPTAPPPSHDGTLEIAHDHHVPEGSSENNAPSLPSLDESTGHDAQQEDIDDLLRKITEPAPAQDTFNDVPSRATEPPTFGGTFTANTVPEDQAPPTDPLSLPSVDQPLLKREEPAQSAPKEQEPPSSEPPALPTLPQPQPPVGQPAEDQETLSEIEEAVHSSHLQSSEQGQQPAEEESSSSESDVDKARDAVQEALNSGPETGLPKPNEGIGAVPVNLDLHPDVSRAESPEAATTSHQIHIDDDGNLQLPTQPAAPEPITTPPAAQVNEPAPGEDISPAARPLDMPLPPAFTPPAQVQPPLNPNAPPPVPPPMVPPPFINPNDPNNHQ